MKLRLGPPLVIENLLPYDLQYIILDQNARQEFDGQLAKGYAGPIHTVDLAHLLGLKILIPKTGKISETSSMTSFTNVSSQTLAPAILLSSTMLRMMIISMKKCL